MEKQEGKFILSQPPLTEEARREILYAPMGYSKWLEHGTKYGYLNFYNKYL